MSKPSGFYDSENTKGGSETANFADSAGVQVELGPSFDLSDTPLATIGIAEGPPEYELSRANSGKDSPTAVSACSTEAHNNSASTMLPDDM